MSEIPGSWPLRGGGIDNPKCYTEIGVSTSFSMDTFSRSLRVDYVDLTNQITNQWTKKWIPVPPRTGGVRKKELVNKFIFKIALYNGEIIVNLTYFGIRY